MLVDYSRDDIELDFGMLVQNPGGTNLRQAGRPLHTGENGRNCKASVSRVGNASKQRAPTEDRIDGVVCQTAQLRPQSKCQQVEELPRELRRREDAAGGRSANR